MNFKELEHLENAFAQNLCLATYTRRYVDASDGAGSAALAECPSLQPPQTEWIRRFDVSNEWRRGLCSPEDIVTCPVHEDDVVCQKCRVLVCHLCWAQWRKKNCSGIPRCLAKDNFQDYADAFIVQNPVGMIEAICAAPVFTSLITYYVEGTRMLLLSIGASVAEPERSYVVRGDVFTLLMPWKKITDQLKDFEGQGWPHAPQAVSNFVRIIFKNCDTVLLKNVKELHVRPDVALNLALLYARRYHTDVTRLLELPAATGPVALQKPSSAESKNLTLSASTAMKTADSYPK